MIITKKQFNEAIEKAKKDAAEEVYRQVSAEDRRKDDERWNSQRFDDIDRRLSVAFTDINRRLTALELNTKRKDDEPVCSRY